MPLTDADTRRKTTAAALLTEHQEDIDKILEEFEKLAAKAGAAGKYLAPIHFESGTAVPVIDAVCKTLVLAGYVISGTQRAGGGIVVTWE